MIIRTPSDLKALLAVAKALRFKNSTLEPEDQRIAFIDKDAGERVVIDCENDAIIFEFTEIKKEDD